MTDNLPSLFFFSFYESLPRQGPGDDHVTRSLLSDLPDLPEYPGIMDMGCGTGHQTLILAERGKVTAVDIHKPFLDTLMKRAEEKNLSERITPLISSMDAIPEGMPPVDLIWSEGAVYLIGFEEGLRYWYSLVKPGGYVVVSEFTRLSDNPPEEVFRFWSNEYPQARPVEENCRIAESIGFCCLQTCTLPVSAWTRFYSPQKDKIMLLRGGSLTPEEERILNEIEQEIGIQEKYPDEYGYVFYVLQRPA